MSKGFIYPTIKNMSLVFIFLQIVPIFVVFFLKTPTTFWLTWEIIALSFLIQMPIKPISEMDERELYLTLKWKSRILDFIAPCTFIPILLLSFDPGVNGWKVFTVTAIPAYLIIIVSTILYKRDFGTFFVKEKADLV